MGQLVSCVSRASAQLAENNTPMCPAQSILSLSFVIAANLQSIKLPLISVGCH